MKQILGRQQVKFGGKEFDDKHGLYIYDFHTRLYDPSFPGFLTMDPLAEKYYSWSPYAYCLNNPLKYVDHDGRTPAHIVAGIFGGVLDYGLQVATNYVEGKSHSEAWTNISAKSIIVSAGTSAAGIGLATKIGQVSKFAKMGKVAKTTMKVTGEMAVDATMSATNQLIDEGTIDVMSTVIDATTSQIAGKTVGKKVKSNAQNSPQGKLFQKEANRAQRLASGDAPRESRIQKAKELTKKSENYGNKRTIGSAMVTSKMTSEGVGVFKKKKENEDESEK